MKYKFRKSLLAIIFAPFALTLMANSTAPRPVEEEYKDFTYTLVSKTYNDGVDMSIDPYTYLEYEITNTGKYYASSFYIPNPKKKNSKIYLYGNPETTSIFNDESWYYFDSCTLIGPGYTKHLYGKAVGYRPEELGNKLTVKAEAYSSLAKSFSLTSASISFVETNEREETFKYLYKTDFEYDYNDTSNHLDLVYTIVYKGKEYYFMDDSHRSISTGAVYNISTSEELDLEQVTIANPMLVISKSRGGGGGLAILAALLLYGAAIIGIGFIGIAVIAGIIVMIVLLVKRHNRQLDMQNIDTPDNNRID